MLTLAHVNLHIFGLTGLTDHHTGIYLFPGPYEQNSSLLRLKQSVSYRLTRFKSDYASLFPELNISLVWCILIKNRIDDTLALCICHEFAAVPDKASCRNRKLQSLIPAGYRHHVLQFTLTGSQLFYNISRVAFRHINICDLHRFALSAFGVFTVQNLCFAYRKLISFTTHILDKNRQVEFTSSRHLETVCGIGFFDTK